MLEMMVAATDVDKLPAILLEPGDDFTTVHVYIIHTIHTVSIAHKTNQYNVSIR